MPKGFKIGGYNHEMYAFLPIHHKNMQTAEIISIIYQEVLKIAGGAAVVLAGLSVFLSKIWSERIARREGEARDQRITALKAQLDSQAAEIKARLDVAVQRTVQGV